VTHDSLYWLVEAERAYHFADHDDDRTRKQNAELVLARRLHEEHPYSKKLGIFNWLDIANTIMGDYLYQRERR
jgi:hypothetical protein